MQIEAIYDHGRLEFIHPIQFKHGRLNLVVNVPDEEIVTEPNLYNLPQEVIDQAKALLARMDAIRNAPLPPDNDLPELTPKQLERIDAFELRAQMRIEQGRPV